MILNKCFRFLIDGSGGRHRKPWVMLGDLG
jgi:hypothetical protein